MKTITAINTLYYYDGPQVIEARDAIGGHYVAVMVESLDEHDRYLVVGVSPERLRQFRSGTLDLRTLLASASDDEWYFAPAPAGLHELMALEPQHRSLVESGLLPDEGFVLHESPTDDLALNEARRRNNLVLEVTSNLPEANGEHRIRVSTYTGLLNYVQTILGHAYRASLRGLSTGNRNRSYSDEAHMMDVVIPACAGSFRVVLEASQKPDMFGVGELSRALQRMDMLFEHTDSPQETLATLKEHRGHLAGSYLRFLNFLVQHNIGLRYSWAQPFSLKANYRAVSKSEAVLLVEVLSGVSNLGSEPVTLIGEFERVNRHGGSWGLLTEDGVRSGKIKDNGPSFFFFFSSSTW